MVVGGQASHELQVEVPASQAWELYGSLALANLVEQSLPGVVDKIEVLQGNGEVGSILKLTYSPAIPGPGWHKEKFVKIDNERRVKEAEIIEGGYLELGFSFYLVRFEIVENEKAPAASCIIKSIIEYELKEEAAADAGSFASIDLFANIAEIAKTYLLDQNQTITNQVQSQVQMN